MSDPSPQINDPARELASRESDDVTVVLLWNPGDDAVTLAVVDSRTGESFEVPVARDRALEAFHHPFAYGDVRAGHHPGGSQQAPSARRALRRGA